MDSQSREGKLECHICIYFENLYWQIIKQEKLIFTLQSQPNFTNISTKNLWIILRSWKFVSQLLESSHKNGYLEHEPYTFSLHYKSIHILLNHGSVAPEIK